MMATKTFTGEDLRQFSGTAPEDRMRHRMTGYLMTEGIVFLAMHGCGWLVDKIAILSRFKKLPRKCDGHQFWTLRVNPVERTATLRCTDGGHGGPEKTCYREAIDWTDCPVEEIRIYVCEEGPHQVVMLSNEY